MRLFLGVGVGFEDREIVRGEVLDGITGVSDTYHQNMRVSFFGDDPMNAADERKMARDFENASGATGWETFDDGILAAEFESRGSQALRTEDGVFQGWKLVDKDPTPVVFATREVLDVLFSEPAEQDDTETLAARMEAFAEIVEEWNPEAASLLREAARELEKD